jgi:UDP-N-acetylglucosamine acyltransferase
VNPGIHPSALVDRSASLGSDVEIGPWVLVGPNVEIGDGCRLAARVTLERNVRLADGVQLGVGAVLGSAPQDVAYRGEETWVEVGRDSVIREYVTINRGTAASRVTRVGERCFLMTYVHLGHDCQVGNDVTIANATELSGHVTIQEHANLSGLIAVHQFVTIGAYAFVGGASRVNQDVPPFVKAVGNPMKLYGLNTVGLRRVGFSAETIQSLKHAYRMVFNSDLPLSRAIERVRGTVPSAEVERLLDFLELSARGVPA